LCVCVCVVFVVFVVFVQGYNEHALAS
jgi:hypothetical protein